MVGHVIDGGVHCVVEVVADVGIAVVAGPVVVVASVDALGIVRRVAAVVDAPDLEEGVLRFVVGPTSRTAVSSAPQPNKMTAAAITASEVRRRSVMDCPQSERVDGGGRPQSFYVYVEAPAVLCAEFEQAGADVVDAVALRRSAMASTSTRSLPTRHGSDVDHTTDDPRLVTDRR